MRERRDLPETTSQELSARLRRELGRVKRFGAEPPVWNDIAREFNVPIDVVHSRLYRLRRAKPKPRCVAPDCIRPRYGESNLCQSHAARLRYLLAKEGENQPLRSTQPADVYSKWVAHDRLLLGTISLTD